MRIIRLRCWVAFLTIVVAACDTLDGALIIVTPGNTSYVAAEDNNADANRNYQYFDTVPYTAASAATQGTSTITIQPNVTTSKFSFGSVGSEKDPHSEIIPQLTINFTAGASALFSLFGSATTTGGDQEVLVSLYDRTSQTDAYSFVKYSLGSATTLLDGSGGPLGGMLISGDNYIYNAEIALLTDNGVAAPISATSNFGISFSQLPEPRPIAMILLPMGLMLLIRNR